MALPDINIRMTADTQSAEQGVNRLQSQVERLQKEFGILFDKQGRARNAQGAFVKMTNELRTAMRNAGISMADVAAEARRVGAAADQASEQTRRFGDSADRMSSRMATVTRGSGNLQRGIQNAAFQVGDFAVMVGAGADASRALALQLPQLLGGFGALGAVLGAVVAIGIPLATAFGNMSTQGRDLTEVFGTLQPVAQAVVTAFGALRDMSIEAAEVVINNLDRILIIGATAATFFAGRWVAGMVAARIATFSLAGALTTLRTALIRTGFGAVIVLAGEAVYQFTRATQAVGSFAIAFGMLKDVAAEVWERIQALTAAGISYLGAQFTIMETSFIGALTRMAVAASDFFAGLSANLASVPGMEGIAGTFGDVSTGLLRAASGPSQNAARRRAEAEEAADAARGAMSGAFAPLESVQKIRDLLAGIKDDRITLPDLLGVGEDDAEGGGGGGAAKKLDEELSAQEQRVQEHFDRLKALTEGGLSDKLGAWGNYFDNLVALTGTRNERLLAIGKTFAAGQALIDAWTAHNRVLADPSLPWWARIASAAQVFAAGIGAVNAIKSVGGGGSGGGGAGATTAPTVAAAAPPEKFVNVNVSGNIAMSGPALIEQINSLLADGYTLKGIQTT